MEFTRKEVIIGGASFILGSIFGAVLTNILYKKEDIQLKEETDEIESESMDMPKSNSKPSNSNYDLSSEKEPITVSSSEFDNMQKLGNIIEDQEYVIINDEDVERVEESNKIAKAYEDREDFINKLCIELNPNMEKLDGMRLMTDNEVVESDSPMESFIFDYATNSLYTIDEEPIGLYDTFGYVLSDWLLDHIPETLNTIYVYDINKNMIYVVDLNKGGLDDYEI